MRKGSQLYRQNFYYFRKFLETESDFVNEYLFPISAESSNVPLQTPDLP